MAGRLWPFVLLALLASPIACRRADTTYRQEFHTPIRVVCTTGMVADLVANVGRPHLVVETLMGPGVDPHLYKPTPGDVRRLTAADMVFYSGLHLEGRLASMLESLAQRKHTYAVTDRLLRSQPQSLRHMEDAEGVHDPHVWFDVSLWAVCAEYVAECLIGADPAHADDYRRNAAEYTARLRTLHERCRQELATIPKPQRVLVTAHDAFGYFGDAYEVEVHGLQGMSTTAEADLGSVNDLIEMLATRRIKAVFVESSVPVKNIRALVEGCEARGHAVRIGGELFSDALGESGTPEGTYIGMVESNLRTIVEALK